MNQLEVIIDQGKLRGSIATDIHGVNYYCFQGIPYAKPPLGELRFKAPVAPEKWTGIFDATKEGSPCYAGDLFKRPIIKGSEDCLVLNVYTKIVPGSKHNINLRPVMFYVHGGGFIFGHGGTELHGPDFLITEDVVIVTINYRLGMLGFLNFGDSSLGVPGNAGLKDMVMALKWVQKNISHFCGDPNNVTIFGQSAGGAAVHLLVLSPLSTGLFHKAIAQSGCALNPWVIGQQGVKDLAAVIGLDGSDEKTVYKYLMEKSVKEIYEIQEKCVDNIVASEVRPFSVVIEKNSDEPAFLADEPINIMLSGKFNHVPFMAGYTTAEGMCFELFKNPNCPERPTFEDIIPWFFGYQLGSVESKVVSEKIKKFYYGAEEQSQQNIEKKYTMLSDTMFVYGIYVTAMIMLNVSKAPFYLYRVSVETELNFFKNILGITLPGASHCDELGYLFTHFQTPEIKPGSVEYTSMTRFVRLWTNFAKYGNPTPKGKDSVLSVVWKALEGKKLDFLDIGQNLTATSNPEPERMSFWTNLFASSPAGQKTECTYLKSSK